MATGFAAIQRNTITSTSGYKTLFEKITEKTEIIEEIKMEEC